MCWFLRKQNKSVTKSILLVTQKKKFSPPGFLFPGRYHGGRKIWKSDGNGLMLIRRVNNLINPKVNKSVYLVHNCPNI